MPQPSWMVAKAMLEMPICHHGLADSKGWIQ